MSEAPASTTQTTVAVSKRNRSLRWAVGGALCMGVFAGLIFHSSLEPVTGVGLGGYCFFIGIHMLMAFLIMLAAFWRGGEFMLLLVSLYVFCVPSPSKPAAKFVLVNEMGEEVRVRLARTDNPRRSTTLSVPPGGQAVHRTASGDYAETITVEFAVGESRMTATIGQLRTNQVAVTTSGLKLIAKVRSEP
jgi:hypothetical protein